MSKKSKFLPPLWTRDGLNYPNLGSWIRNVSFNKLAILARNLDTSKSKDSPDKLHSVPTPWARLLLFDQATERALPDDGRGRGPLRLRGGGRAGERGGG